MLKKMKRAELSKMCGINDRNWEKNKAEVYAYLGAIFKKVVIKKMARSSVVCTVEFKDGIKEVPKFNCREWRGIEQPENVTYEDLTELMSKKI